MVWSVKLLSLKIAMEDEVSNRMEDVVQIGPNAHSSLYRLALAACTVGIHLQISCAPQLRTLTLKGLLYLYYKFYHAAL